VALKEIAMIEIKPLSPSHPVIKPVKIKNDEHPPKRSLPEKKSHPDDQDSEPVTHIDESV
jgi:hypothetical protein